MTIRKYLLSRRVVGSAFAVLPVVSATRKPALGQRSWVLWLLWAGGFVLSLATVRQESTRRATADAVPVRRVTTQSR